MVSVEKTEAMNSETTQSIAERRTEIEVGGSELEATITEVSLLDGFVPGMKSVTGHNGRYVVTISWPQMKAGELAMNTSPPGDRHKHNADEGDIP